MGIEAFYLSKQTVSGMGSIFLLNELQKAESTGGGKALLGAVVQENKASYHKDYPVPILVSESRIIVKKLTTLKNQLGIQDDIVVEQEIAAGNRTVKIEKDKSFQLGLGPFPAVPFNAKFQIDFKKTVDITISYGDGTLYQYIRKGDMMKLYTHLNGNPDADMTGNFLKKNAFISRIQLAKNWSVTFKSTKTFDAGVEAQIDLFNKDNSIGGSVSIKKKTETTLEAKVTGNTYYLVGLMSTRWNDVNPN